MRYNLGTGRGYSVREVIRTAEEVTGKPIAVKEGPRRPGDPPSLVAAADAIRRDARLVAAVSGIEADHRDGVELAPQASARFREITLRNLFRMPIFVMRQLRNRAASRRSTMRLTTAALFAFSTCAAAQSPMQPASVRVPEAPRTIPPTAFASTRATSTTLPREENFVTIDPRTVRVQQLARQLVVTINANVIFREFNPMSDDAEVTAAS